MIIRVKKDKTQYVREIPQYARRQASREEACQLAFRHVYGRRENSYQELWDATEVLDALVISEETAKFLLETLQ